MAKKHKYYVVWKGRETGVFSSWDECKESINGFEGAQYKSYASLEEARAAHKMNYWVAIKGSGVAAERSVTSVGKAIVPSLSVDAACSGNPGVMEYRGVDTATGREIFRLGPFLNATNNIGEFLALVHGLAYLKKEGLNMPIYSDSISAIAWVRKKECKTKLAQTNSNTQVFNLIARAESWLKMESFYTQIIKWETDVWGEIPADFGRK